jgi:hypothetical protein
MPDVEFEEKVTNHSGEYDIFLDSIGTAFSWLC